MQHIDTLRAIVRHRKVLLSSSLFALLAAGCGPSSDTTDARGDEPIGTAQARITLQPTTRLAGPPDDVADLLRAPRVSRDGQIVVYKRWAGGTNGLRRVTRAPTPTVTTLLSGRVIDAFDMSADGDVIAFLEHSTATATKHVYRLVVSTGAIQELATDASAVAISKDGRSVAFVTPLALVPTDTNGAADVYLWDQAKNSTNVVSTQLDGTPLVNQRVEGNVFLGEDANTLAYQYHDLLTGKRTLVAKRFTVPNNLDVYPGGEPKPATASPPSLDAVTPDGRYWLGGFCGVKCVYDIETHSRIRADVSTAGVGGGSTDQPATISDDGRFVVFPTYSGSIVIEDTNGEFDLFIRDRYRASTLLLTSSPSGGASTGNSGWEKGVISGNGFEAFMTARATNLVLPSPPAGNNVYVRHVDQAAVDDTIQVNQYLSTGTTGLGYQHQGAATTPFVDVWTDGSKQRATRIKGTGSYIGRTGLTSTLEIDVAWNGSAYKGWARLTDGTETYDTRTAGTPNVSATLLSDREVMVDFNVPGAGGRSSGLRLAIKRANAFPIVTAGWAWAHAATGDYDANTLYSYNALGWVNHITKLATGQYRVKFSRQAGALGANIQVQAYGGDNNYCKLERQEDLYGDLAAYVRCFNGAGAPIDSRFVTSFIYDKRNTGAPGVAWANYASTITSQGNTSGSEITVTRTSTGVYSVSFPGQSASPANVQVTATGTSNERCKISDWSGTTATVRCHVPGGSPIDASFNVLWVSNQMAHSLTGGFVHASSPTSASYTPTASRSFNSSGGANGAGFSGSAGSYLQFVTFGGLNATLSTVHVTATGTDASYCKPQGWYSSSGTTRVDVKCFDASGTSTRAPHALAFMNL